MMKWAKKRKAMKVVGKEIAQPLTGGRLEVERLVSFALLFLVLCHNLACLWFLVARLEDFGERTWVARHEYSHASETE